jgi:hypothetical protein
MLPEDGISIKHPDPPDIPDKNYALFGGGIAPIPPGALWEKRVGIAMILGVCPTFLLRFPQITDTDLLRFISQDQVALSTLQEKLTSSINAVAAHGQP